MLVDLADLIVGRPFNTLVCRAPAKAKGITICPARPASTVVLEGEIQVLCFERITTVWC
jgi:hypothetical protein